MYKLKFVAHCGMSYNITDELNLDEARQEIASLICLKREKRYSVNTLEKGKEYEFTEPKDYALVPDDAGILELVDLDEGLPTCNECGKPCREVWKNQDSTWTSFEFCSNYCAKVSESTE